MATKNLFSTAKKSATVKTSKKEDTKPRIVINDPDFFTKVQDMEKHQAAIKSSEAKFTMIADEVKALGKDRWAELYEKMGRNPESVMLEARDGDDIAQVMFLAQDKYITINEEKAEELRSSYGDDIVEESTTFAFDNDMIEKYGEVISDLIQNSDEIADKDKSKIIKAVVKMTVAKGTIDKFLSYGDNVAEIMEATRPVVALKGAEVIKG